MINKDGLCTVVDNEIAYLNAGLVLTLKDNRQYKDPNKNVMQVFYHAGGRFEYAELLCQSKKPLFGDGSPFANRKPKAKKGQNPQIHRRVYFPRMEPPSYAPDLVFANRAHHRSEIRTDYCYDGCQC